MSTDPKARLWQRALMMLAAILAVTAVALLLAWLTGRLVSDRFGWSQWLLWIPTPAALGAVLLGLVAACRPAPRRRRRLLGWSLTLALVGGYFLFVEHRFLRAGASNPQGIRLVHWTMSHNRRYQGEAHVERLVTYDGDITILSQMTRFARRQPLRDALTLDGEVYTLGPFSVLSRFPVTEWRWMFNNEEVVGLFARVDTTERLGRPIVIHLLDLPSNFDVPRMDTARKARRLLDQSDAPPPDLVLGDFNMTRGSASLATIYPDLHHAFDDAGAGYGATYRRSLPMYHIDHILLNDSLRATWYELVDTGFGRHLVQIAHIDK